MLSLKIHWHHQKKNLKDAPAQNRIKEELNVIEKNIADLTIIKKKIGLSSELQQSLNFHINSRKSLEKN